MWELSSQHTNTEVQKVKVKGIDGQPIVLSKDSKKAWTVSVIYVYISSWPEHSSEGCKLLSIFNNYNSLVISNSWLLLPWISNTLYFDMNETSAFESQGCLRDLIRQRGSLKVLLTQFQSFISTQSEEPDVPKIKVRLPLMKELQFTLDTIQTETETTIWDGELENKYRPWDDFEDNFADVITRKKNAVARMSLQPSRLQLLIWWILNVYEILFNFLSRSRMNHALNFLLCIDSNLVAPMNNVQVSQTLLNPRFTTTKHFTILKN